MGWSTSIHAATSEVASVLAALQRLGEHDCLVGHSGDKWVGVYSQACEDTAGKATPELASKLSETSDDYVLGVCLDEEGFKYWLFRQGKLLDQHPVGRIASFFTGNSGRELLRLAKSPQLKQQMEIALAPKKHRRPHEILGLTEAEFMAESSRELARVHAMSPVERKQMEEKYARLRSPHEEDFKSLCEAIGIRESNWNYSDLAEAEKAPEVHEVWSSMGLRFLN